MTATFQLPEVALRLYCIERMRMSPAVYAMVTSTSVIPWSLKPVWGFWIDNMKYRTFYIALSTTGFYFSWGLLSADYAMTPASLSVLLTASSFCLCVVDVMADAQIVNFVRKESAGDAGRLQATVWTVRAAGALVAAIAGGALARYVSLKTVFFITACTIVPGGIGLAMATDNGHVTGCHETRLKVKLLCKTIQTRPISRPCVFVFVLSAVPSCYYALVVFMQTTLRFTPMQFATIDASAHLAHIVGAQVYSRYLRKKNFRTIFYGGIGILTFLRILQLVLILRLNVKADIPDLVFCVAESVAFSIVSQIMMMPICVLGARLCPEGIEGSLYSTLMSVSNFGGLVAAWTGAGLTAQFGVSSENFSNLWQLSLMCTVFTLVPLLFVRLVPPIVPGRDHPDTNSSRHTGHDACSLQAQ